MSRTIKTLTVVEVSTDEESGLSRLIQVAQDYGGKILYRSDGTDGKKTVGFYTENPELLQMMLRNH